jgi:hypothetical protein
MLDGQNFHAASDWPPYLQSKEKSKCRHEREREKVSIEQDARLYIILAVKSPTLDEMWLENVFISGRPLTLQADCR